MTPTATRPPRPPLAPSPHSPDARRTALRLAELKRLAAEAEANGVRGGPGHRLADELRLFAWLGLAALVFGLFTGFGLALRDQLPALLGAIAR